MLWQCMLGLILHLQTVIAEKCVYILEREHMARLKHIAYDIGVFQLHLPDFLDEAGAVRERIAYGLFLNAERLYQ